MGGRQRKRVRERGGGLFYVCIGYQPKVCPDLQSWLAYTQCKSVIPLFVFHNHALSLILS